MAYEGPEYWTVIYKAIGDFGQLMKDAAAAKAALQDMANAVKAESAAEVAGSTAAAAARQKDVVAIQQEVQALSQLANAAKQTNVQLLYGGRNDMTQHLSDLSQELTYTTLLNRQKWLGFSSVQQAMSYRQQMYQLALLENRAHFAGYLTADQYLGFLQRETANVAALSAAIRTRTGAITAETSALLAHTNALEGTHRTFGDLGAQLSGSGSYSAALQALPPVVTTRALFDASQAIAAAAEYHRVLAALPASERTNVFAAVTPLPGLPAGVPGLGAVPGFGGRVPVPVGASDPLAAAAAELSDSVRELSPGMAISADIISRWGEHARLAAVDALALERGVSRLDAALQLLDRTRSQVAGGQLMDIISLLEGGSISNVPHGYPVAAPAQFVAAERLQLEGAGQVASQLREVASEAADAGNEFSYLDEMMAMFGRERIHPQVDDAQLEAARTSAEELAAEMAALSHDPVEIDVELNDTAALAELDVLHGRVLTAEEQGKALMSLLGQGGASGGGGGGGPPPPRAGAAGGGNPDDEAARALLAEIDALFQKAGNDAEAMGVKASKASKDTAAAVTSMIAPVTGAAAGWFGLLTQVNLWGGLLPGVLGHTTALHFVLDAIIETLAILIPAIVTMAAGLTAFGIAGYDAGKQVYDRFNAIHTVMDATGATIPPMTRNLENLHNVVRPQVWQLYGDAITVASNRAGLFNQLAVQTGNTIDRLAARLTVDLTRSGGGLQTFLSVGAQDLAKLGIIFDNLGRALLAFIKVTQETHVDQIFLNLFVALSQLLVLVTKLPTPLLAVAIGLHAFWLWGGLLATVVLQLLNPLRALALALGAVDAASVAGGLSSLTKDASAWQKLSAGLTDIAAGFGALPARLNIFSRAAKDTTVAAGDAAVATEGLGTAAADTAVAGGGLAAMLGRLGPALSNPYVLIGAVAAALAGVATYLALMPDATQKWINSLNQALTKASAFTVISQTVGDLASVTTELAKAQATGAGNATELAGAQRGLSADLSTELTHVGAVSRAYGTDMVGALGLLNAAGVKTSDIFSAQGDVWAGDLQQVKGLVAGYAAMGQGLSALQQDVSVQLVNTSAQVTAMGKLNQAWDTWTTTVAAAPSAFIAMAQGFTQFTKDAAAAGASMTALTPASLTLQSDFQANYSNVQKFFDAFRNDQALTGQGDFTKFVKDAVASLIPMAGGSKEAAAQISALAQEAGGPATTNIKTLQQWVGNIKNPLEQMYKASNDAAIGASNLSQDAQRLTTTLQQQLNPAMAKAVFNAHGGQAAFDTFASNLVKFGPGSQATIKSAKSVATELLAIEGNSKSAKATFVGFAETLGLSAKQADQLWAQSTQHITANLGQVRKQLAATAGASPPKLGTPGTWGQIEHAFMAGWDGVFNWFKNSLPHAVETAWDAVFHWFSSSLPHGLKTAWAPVSKWFDATFTHDIPAAWNKAWSAVASPVTRAFDSVKHWITSNFDTWWKTHGSAVEQIWHEVWSKISGDATAALRFIESDAKAVWHGIETAATSSWHFITSLLTSGPARQIWNGFATAAKDAWSLVVSGARGAWAGVVDLARAAWAAVAALAKTAWSVISNTIIAVARSSAAVATGIFKVLWDNVVAFARISWDAIVFIINEVLNLLTGHWATAWKDMQNFGVQVWNALRTAAGQTWNAISTAATQVWNAIWNALKSTGSAAWNAIRTGGEQVWNNLWNAFVGSLINPLINFFTRTLPNVISSAVSGAVNSAVSFARSALSFIPGLAAGGGVPMASGSVPGTGDEDGTHIIAMGGEFVIRKPARMALQAAFGPEFLPRLNQADTWLGAGSRGNAASQRGHGFGFGHASGGPAPASASLSSLAAVFGHGMAAGGEVPVILVPGMSPTLTRQLSATAAQQLPRTVSEAGSGARGGLHVDQLVIHNPVKERPSDSITRSSQRLMFLAGKGMV